MLIAALVLSASLANAPLTGVEYIETKDPNMVCTALIGSAVSGRPYNGCYVIHTRTIVLPSWGTKRFREKTRRHEEQHALGMRHAH